MATVPTSGTNIRLLTGINFQVDYKHSRWFDDVAQQTSYFLDKPVIHSMTQANFQRIEGKHFISVNKSIDALLNTNYLMFQNAQYNSKWFYAFVTKLEYKQKETTYVHFELDVLQTWKTHMYFKPSYVVREHRRLWNTDGTPVINTVDEGLDYGSDYETVAVEHYQPFETLYFMVIVTKSIMHTKAGVTENEITPILNGVPQPLSYYIHPFKLNGQSPNTNLGTISNALQVLKGLSVQKGAVNNIVSIYITDYTGVNFTYDGTTLTVPYLDFEKVTVTDNVEENISTIYVKDSVSYNNKFKIFENKYADYTKDKESKLLMYPYTVLLMDDLKGNRVTIKNEFINSNDIKVTIRGSMGTSNKVVYSLLDYLNNDIDLGDEFISSYDNSVINNNPNDLPVITDLLAAFLQGNRNSIENQKNSLIFNNAMDTIGGVVSGGASAVTGNIGGVVDSGMGVVKGMGNTVLALQGIQAKQKDIGNTPPSLAKMGGNTNFDYGNRISGVYLIKKQIRSEYRKKLSDFFNMFGYKVNEVVIPNFHTRRYWNYVETKSCNITGNFNNEDLLELKSIFDNGITLWHTDDIGNYSLDNEVIN